MLWLNAMIRIFIVCHFRQFTHFTTHLFVLCRSGGLLPFSMPMHCECDTKSGKSKMPLRTYTQFWSLHSLSFSFFSFICFTLTFLQRFRFSFVFKRVLIFVSLFKNQPTHAREKNFFFLGEREQKKKKELDTFHCMNRRKYAHLGKYLNDSGLFPFYHSKWSIANELHLLLLLCFFFFFVSWIYYDQMLIHFVQNLCQSPALFCIPQFFSSSCWGLCVCVCFLSLLSFSVYS